jgi:hypothetical protein
LELKNGTLIKGTFMGGTESGTSFQVGSSVHKYNLADIVSLKFDSERAASDQPNPSTSSLPSKPQPAEHAGMKTRVCHHPGRNAYLGAHHRCNRFHAETDG